MLKWQQQQHHQQKNARLHRVWQPVRAVRWRVRTTKQTQHNCPQIRPTTATRLGKRQVKGVKISCLKGEALFKIWKYMTPKRHCVSPQTLRCSCGEKQGKSLWLCQIHSERESFSLSNLLLTEVHKRAAWTQVWADPFLLQSGDSCVC